ncbi:MAG: ATP synthase F1 subunit gamma [Firmicutes bacterium]|nr:ATP synthase F1 subunit gamma [Bacillota bacterium]MDD7734010.1 ATP synthase F1 subunit gamma [Bacillota bacterium]
MASMSEIRTRISSVQDTMKITNAMYLISSAKLRKAKSGHEKVSPYFRLLQQTIADILDRCPDLEEDFFEETSPRTIPENGKRRTIIVISSDKGLAGSYNHNVFKKVEELIADDSENTLILVGHMAVNYFKNFKNVTIDEKHVYPAADPAMYRARDIAEHVIGQFLENEVDEVYVAYTDMINSMSFETQTKRIMPLSTKMFENIEVGEHLREPVFSPSPEAVIKHVAPNYIKGLIYGAMVESYACEQSARMTAMDNATTNAKDMIRELSLAYNRERQAAITQEITEIVGGASAQ